MWLRIWRGRTGLVLIVLLSLAVLAPSLCLLWFANQAASNERFAARQKLMEAYKAHLELAQQRVQAQFDALLHEIEASAAAPRELFAQVIRDGAADSLVLYGPSGTLLYPARAGLRRAELETPWPELEAIEQSEPSRAAEAYGIVAAREAKPSLAALALQAKARCEIKSGDEPQAAKTLHELTTNPAFLHAVDAEGRLLGPNAELMLLEIAIKAAPPQVAALSNRLERELSDYAGLEMPSAQRRFLDAQLSSLFPTRVRAKTSAGEELAAAYLEASPGKPRETGLHLSPLPGIWQFSADRFVVLYRAETLTSKLMEWARPQTFPADLSLEILPPGREAELALVSLPLAKGFPGWRLALGTRDKSVLDTAARQRAATYVWTGALVLACVGILSLLALTLMRRQLELTRLQNDLVANVSHELKTPLASMRLLVDTLLGNGGADPKTTREYLQLIAGENERLSRLIQNFLTFSRIERNKLVFERRRVRPEDIAESAAAVVRERFHEPGCRFEMVTGANLPPIEADADALTSALVNLLDNAWKYSDEPRYIVLSVEREGRLVRFAVRDNGIGLSARETRLVFKRFYRAKDALTQHRGGCGLGLSIVQFIIAAHGGEIRVDSQPGAGSTFAMLLPAAVPIPESPQPVELEQT